MKLKQFGLLLSGISSLLFANAQTAGTSKKEIKLNDLTISTIRTINGIGRLAEEKDGIIYAGKKMK